MLVTKNLLTGEVTGKIDADYYTYLSNAGAYQLSKDGVPVGLFFPAPGLSLMYETPAAATAATTEDGN